MHYFFCCTISAHFVLCTVHYIHRKNGQMNGERGAYWYRPNQKFRTTACRVASSHNATLHYVATVTIALISERVNTSSTRLVQYQSQNEINSHFVKYTQQTYLEKCIFCLTISVSWCKTIFLFLFLCLFIEIVPLSLVERIYQWIIIPWFSISVTISIENQSLYTFCMYVICLTRTIRCCYYISVVYHITCKWYVSISVY